MKKFLASMIFLAMIVAVVWVYNHPFNELEIVVQRSSKPGTVLFWGYIPVSFADVVLKKAGEVVLREKADVSGKFRISNLSPSKYRLILPSFSECGEANFELERGRSTRVSFIINEGGRCSTTISSGPGPRKK